MKWNNLVPEHREPQMKRQQLPRGILEVWQGEMRRLRIRGEMTCPECQRDWLSFRTAPNPVGSVLAACGWWDETGPAATRERCRRRQDVNRLGASDKWAMSRAKAAIFTAAATFAVSFEHTKRVGGTQVPGPSITVTKTNRQRGPYL